MNMITDKVHKNHYFTWNNTTLYLHDRTINEAIEVAKKFGYEEKKWYKPWLNNSHLYWD